VNTNFCIVKVIVKNVIIGNVDFLKVRKRIMKSDVSISTNEKDLDIKYGMIDFGPEREAARTSVKYILSDLNDIRRFYIHLGFHLSEFETYEYYKDFGYASLQEFCDANIGLDKSAVSRCIGVFRAFNASLDNRYVNGTISKGSAMELGTCWKKFSYSQLCEMLSLDDKTRELVKPEMTIKQIRELKKNKRNVSQVKDNVSQVATSQQDFLKKVQGYSGIVLQNYIKGIPVEDCEDVKHITLYDSQGKEIFKYNTCDILFQDDNHIFLRQVDQEDKEKE